ncbi:MAG: hypothetical protein KJO44_02235 [Gemmatimonadetes bacterium]|nr:hypothetical protein [Gemmatimonadota bacterium]MBT8479632.1 hypothetical protein [Gemmatimonadota bacterium]NNK48499.1 hypothetical protein [Gemmatimonadota bacterium]
MESTTSVPRGARRRTFFMFLGVATFALVVFLVQLVVSLHNDVAGLRDVLATKEDLTNLAMTIGPLDPVEATLTGACGDCHDRATFATAHGEGEALQYVCNLDTDEIDELISRMMERNGVAIAAEDMPRVEAALTYMKCAHCHTIDRIRELAIMSQEERWEVILAMMNEPGATISQEDARRVRDFYGEFWGWHVQ